ncbi:hypothetical protein HanRHA438_Chr03g0105921 [Helianthus annuus]|uniref:Uncharacterized protein n=1 Tax=Helianthus annuus TaxID=4232 RepID=A0A9K3NV71_HELAN|nr:hypothetical protein HanXRQr2_Chr03g0094741 [Helianthus annuus]KAJ0591948.1 hypothetical protein HanHA300_Chr03g0079191 [Helianthus annuus]KAJ0599316.1 hypothetical protein HanIR_Chr03g0103491 [Helianthus annuus]KAJ0606919.1 hypothetical protein HanHA89_Chr03g0090541 [Helianthus annuus]KAJ0766985.1 hypothetical protein HanLR1_Chr03g0083861 [Helianthus annuus]
MENISIPPSHPSLGFFGILKESFKTTSRNWKMLLAILLPSFLSLTQLEFSLDYIHIPPVKHFATQMAEHPNMSFLRRNLHIVTYRNAFEDILEIIRDKHLTLALSCAIKLFFSVAIVSSSSEAYTAKVITHEDFFLKIRRWKEPLHTSIYMIIITFAIICVYLASYGLTYILPVNYSWSDLFSNAISLTIPFCYIYVSPLWTVSVIVSVLEGFGGFNAIRRAAVLMKGKRLQATLLMVPFYITEFFIHFSFNMFLRIYDRRRIKDYEFVMDIWVYYTKGTSCSLKLFMFVAYTVFYHERKRSFDQKELKGILSSP